MTEPRAAADLVAVIRRQLRDLDGRGTDYRIAKAIGCSPSSVSRWSSGDSTPRRKQLFALQMLYRALARASAGHADGIKVRDAFLNSPGLAGMGTVGAAIAAGLGWLVGVEPAADGRYTKLVTWSPK